MASARRRAPQGQAPRGRQARARKSAEARNGDASPTPDVHVVWRQLPANEWELAEHARQIAATVIGHIQRPADAPVLPGPGLGTADDGATAQAAEPISFATGDQRIAAIQWTDPARGIVSLVTVTGEEIKLEAPVKTKNHPNFDRMDASPRPGAKRRPMTINRRPGQGGLIRQRVGQIDPTEGLDEYGEIVWWTVADGASVGLLELDAEGDAVVLCRLSGEEKNDRLIDQLRPCLALARQHGLQVRVVIFAVNMSGTREVRPERAGPPPAGVLEREDILELDKYIEAGWVQHVIARSGDRIAREVLPGETLLARWANSNIALWISDYGRRMNYATDSSDRLSVRMMMVVSAEERNASVRRLQTAHLNKGPFAGNGHLGPTRFGFIRDKHTRELREDPEQWPWILRMFELADAGICLDGDALSTRKLAKQLAEEGCPFDHDRMRKIIKSPIYATGEYTTFVRGVEIQQRPIALEHPVPIDQFQRVQDLLALRKGQSKNTPLGEFLFNSIAAYHAQCEDLRSEKGRSPIVKGYIVPGETKTLKYRHALWVPPCCKGEGRGTHGGFTWEKELLERPVVEAIRELATHPELLKQLQQAARHTVSDSSARLTHAQRTEIAHEIVELGARQDEAIDSWIDRTSDGRHDLAGYEQLMQRFVDKIKRLERRLELDDLALAFEGDDQAPLERQRVGAFLEIMSVETPDDPLLRQLRARLFQQIVSKVLIDDTGEGPITVTLEGHLVPEGAPLEAGNPILAAEALLDAYVTRKRGQTPEAERLLEDVAQIQTDLSGRADKSVSIDDVFPGVVLNLASTMAVRSAERRSLTATGWRMRVDHALKTGEPGWRTTREIKTSDG